MRLSWTTNLGRLHVDDPSPALVDAVRALDVNGTFHPVVEETVLVEVDVATARPVGVHARAWTWVTVPRTDRTSVQVEAEFVAMQMVMCHPHVAMVLGARVIDWEE